MRTVGDMFSAMLPRRVYQPSRVLQGRGCRGLVGGVGGGHGASHAMVCVCLRGMLVHGVAMLPHSRPELFDQDCTELVM